MKLASLVDSTEFFLGVFFAEAAVVLSSALLLRFLDDFGVFASFASSSTLLSTTSLVFFFLEDFGVLAAVLAAASSTFGVSTAASSTTSLLEIDSVLFFLVDFGVFAFLADFFGFSATSSSNLSDSLASTAFCFFSALARGLVAAATFLFFDPLSSSVSSSLSTIGFFSFASSIISSNSSGVLLYTGRATLAVVLMEMERILAYLRGTLVGTMEQMD
mmetsp:Transcript_18243/g.29674  ORF Transcript_18243/g.29674 Transcript_18243/m.29674 type:complete len:217 (+) Transcript_18243:302-952(+)